MRERLYNFLTLKVFFPYCMTLYKGGKTRISPDLFLKAPAGSLGKKVLEFLNRNNISLLPGYERHDIKHVLLGYGANMKGEVSMQYFEWANGNRSLPVLTVMIFGSLLMPEHMLSYWQAYERGASAKPLERWDPVPDLDKNLHAIRKSLHV